MKLTAHFHLREFLRSQTAERLGRVIQAPPYVVQNLTALCQLILEPARKQLDLPFVISSGYRPAWLNDRIGGSKTSAHLDGLAADVLVVGMRPLAFCQYLEGSALPFDQLIWEGSWTHVALAPDGSVARRQVLTAHFGPRGVTYSRGLA